MESPFILGMMAAILLTIIACSIIYFVNAGKRKKVQQEKIEKRQRFEHFCATDEVAISLCQIANYMVSNPSEIIVVGASTFGCAKYPGVSFGLRWDGYYYIGKILIDNFEYSGGLKSVLSDKLCEEVQAIWKKELEAYDNANKLAEENQIKQTLLNIMAGKTKTPKTSEEQPIEKTPDLENQKPVKNESDISDIEL